MPRPATVPTPAKAWSEMVRGNERFVSGTPRHPRQDVERREELGTDQWPDVALFGCSDSRLAAEIIFDKGLGDLFVVRNAGQVISESAIGSLEYAVGICRVPLIVVLAHDSCGAVAAAIRARGIDAPVLPAHVHAVVGPILPAVTKIAGEGAIDPGVVDPHAVGIVHLKRTVATLIERSELIAEAIASGALAVVGANYRLIEGRVEVATVVGNIEEV